MSVPVFYLVLPVAERGVVKIFHCNCAFIFVPLILPVLLYVF